MNLLFWLLLIITFLLFVPIPFRFDIHFSFDNYYIKFYGFSLVSKKNISNRKNKSSKKKKTPPIKEKKNNKKFKKELLFNNIQKSDFKNLISKLYHRHFKPVLYIDSYLSYSLNDASKTAIIFGALSNIKTPMYILLNIIFNVKKYKSKIDPLFKDEYFIDYNTVSIFFLSFAEIIYMIAIVFKYLHNSKEVTPVS